MQPPPRLSLPAALSGVVLETKSSSSPQQLLLRTNFNFQKAKFVSVQLTVKVGAPMWKIPWSKGWHGSTLASSCRHFYCERMQKCTFRMLDVRIPGWNSSAPFQPVVIFLPQRCLITIKASLPGWCPESEMHDGMLGICRDGADVKFPRAVRDKQSWAARTERLAKKTQLVLLTMLSWRYFGRFLREIYPDYRFRLTNRPDVAKVWVL